MPRLLSGVAVGPAASPTNLGIVSRRALSERLSAAGRVSHVSAPAGSGKTLLVRSWIAEAALAERAVWVSVAPGEHDAQRFWLSVLDGLRDATAGSTVVRPVSAAPGLHTEEVVERLLEDLESLEERVWLVIDDLHELRSTEALRQLELLLLRAPEELQFVLITRHDLRLGLHRLRLEGGFTEIRADDLRFTADEARALFRAAGVELSDAASARLVERTEGWAAGLRLAALSLAGHPDAEQFAAEFSGSERTVAEYLLAEVLERQPAEIRRLLLRTSVLERVNGRLADLLTGDSGGERILQELEQANAFVVSLDAARSWFRYHYLFADLLGLELRRTEPGEIRGLHRAAAGWFAEHEYPVEAIHHAQTAKDWGQAARLLADHSFGLWLSGQGAAAHELLAVFPDHVRPGDAELAGLRAARELERGSLEEVERYIDLAAKEVASVPQERRERFQVRFATLRLRLARRRGDVAAVIEEAQQLLATPDALDAGQAGLGDGPRALALIELGIAETWSRRNEEAELHLEQGVALARQLERPYLELLGLVHGARIAHDRSYQLGAQRSMQAVELAGRHGWSEEPLAGVAYVQLAGAQLARGRVEEAERWLERARRSLRAELEPAAGVTLHWIAAELEMARGRPERALAAFQAAERLTELLCAPYVDAVRVRARSLQALVRLGRTRRVEAALAEIDDEQRGTTFMRTVIAALRLAEDDPEAAIGALAPVTAGSVRAGHPIWLVEALLLEATARDALGDAGVARRAIDRALDLAEPDSILFPFLMHPMRELLERHSRRDPTHASLVTEILNLLAGRPPTSPLEEPEGLLEPLSVSETRVLRYLPTNLSLREIGNELAISVHTVKSHIRNLYGKLGVHRRGDAVERARVLGLLAPSSRTR